MAATPSNKTNHQGISRAFNRAASDVMALAPQSTDVENGIAEPGIVGVRVSTD
jgi:hypothetical protein